MLDWIHEHMTRCHSDTKTWTKKHTSPKLLLEKNTPWYFHKKEMMQFSKKVHAIISTVMFFVYLTTLVCNIKHLEY